MFEEFTGIPVHPLLVHGAVVFVPLQVAAAIAYGLWPFARRHIGWLVASLAIVGPAAAYAAKLSGEAFQARLIRNGTTDQSILAKIAEHQGFGNQTTWFSLGLGALMILLIVLRRLTRSVEGRSGSGPAALTWVVTGLGVLVGLTAVYYVVRAGETGAHIAWNGF